MKRQWLEQVCSLKSISHVCIFGSRSRGVSTDHSDLDLVFVGDYSESLKDLISVITKEEKVPHVDLYILPLNKIQEVSVNPKVTTIQIDLKQIWKRSGHSQISSPSLISLRIFCTFLEYERLRNKSIFKDRAMTQDYLKKMPGGRRSFDELVWLSRLCGKQPFFTQEEKIYLRSLQLGSVSGGLFDFWALNLDKSVLSLESRLYPSLKPFERGEDVLRELSSSVYVAYKTSDALELRQLFEKNSSLEIPEAWLVQYAISFNPCIPPDLALRIAVNNQPELFDYEIKKGLLQNRAINYQSNPESE